MITHLPTGITAQAGEKRSQHANLIVALNRLRINLAINLRSDPLPKGPDELWRSRVKNRRINVSPTHPDFPVLLHLALDLVADKDNDLAAAADGLEISTSQLIKLLKANPQVFNHVQQIRKSRNLHPLK